ncbi:MAG: hypothetical protein ROY82_02790 [Truepera sp.]|nr:hypothetical protein [Truepera sp.]
MRKQDWITGPSVAAIVVLLNRNSAFVKPTVLESFFWFVFTTASYYLVSAVIHRLWGRRRS